MRTSARFPRTDALKCSYICVCIRQSERFEHGGSFPGSSARLRQGARGRGDAGGTEQHRPFARTGEGRRRHGAAAAGATAGGEEPQGEHRQLVCLAGRQRPADARLRRADEHRAARTCQEGRGLRAHGSAVAIPDAREQRQTRRPAPGRRRAGEGRHHSQERAERGEHHRDERPSGSRAAARLHCEDGERPASGARPRADELARGAQEAPRLRTRPAGA